MRYERRLIDEESRQELTDTDDLPAEAGLGLLEECGQARSI